MFFIKQEDISFFNTVYIDMTKQFPMSELKSYECFVSLLSGNDYNLYSAISDDICIGYFIVFKDKYYKNLWLDYVAVMKQYQSRGYGHQIFDNLKKYFAKEYNGIYLEVEKPEQSKPNTIRRIKFYESLNAHKLDITYFYPNEEGCLPMDLYFLPFKEMNIPAKNKITGTIQKVFFSIHSDCKHLDNILSKIN